jgi:photosystem II stability/assembly factor-like uncharacterized protein
MTTVRLAPVLPLLIACACVGDDGAAFDTGTAELAATSGPAGTVQSTLLERRGPWRYWDQGVPTSDWKTSPDCSGPGTCFSDDGTAPYGYGESYIVHEVGYGGDPSNRNITTYFKQLFTPPPGVRALFLRVMYDDGFVFYLNGHEGGRSSMPSGTIGHATLATGHEAENRYVTYDITAQIPNLHAGDNMLAFEVHQVSRSSSDLVFDAELIAWVDGPIDVTSREMIPRGDYWHFWDRATSPGMWKAASYDDAGWSAGPGALGYGEDYLATAVNPGTITTYYRKDFTIEGSVNGLTGEVMFDDGFVVYVNGSELGRAGMPSGTVGPSTLALGHEANQRYAIYDWDWAVPLLRRGENVIAVEVHQSGPASSDVVFDLGLVVEGAWTVQQTDVNRLLYDVWFADAQRGWVVGWGGLIHRTLDGGATWTVQPSGSEYELQAIEFAPDGVSGFISSGAGQLVRTRDGGESWTMVVTHLAHIGRVSAIDGDTLWAGGAEIDIGGNWRTGLFKSIDGGVTWTEALDIDDDSAIPEPYFVDASTGWLVRRLSDGSIDISRTTDGGVTWIPRWTGGDWNDRLGGVAAIDTSTLWVVGGGGDQTDAGELKLVTRDGGATWTEVPPTSNDMVLFDVHFVDALHGWAIGARGSVIATGDGGDTWTVQQVARFYADPDTDSGEASYDGAIHMGDLMNGWAIGPQATILHTADGGHGRL